MFLKLYCVSGYSFVLFCPTASKSGWDALLLFFLFLHKFLGSLGFLSFLPESIFPSPVELAG